MVDFLGGLVPGTLFSIGALAALMPPLYVVIDTISSNSTTPLSSNSTTPLFEPFKEFFISIQNSPSVIWFALFIIGLALSYFLGHLFYRQGPNTPNKRSFKKIATSLIIAKEKADKIAKEKADKIAKEKADKSTKEEADKSTKEEAERKISLLKKLKRRIKKIAIFLKFIKEKAEMEDSLITMLKGELASTNENECEFPFPYLKHYLIQRGLIHLCSLVLWDGDNENTRDKRSKTYINLLKIRLQFHHPDKIGTIIRNEAHVRLASSTWYASKTLWWCALTGIGIYFVGYFFGVDLEKNIWGIVPPSFVLLVAWFSWTRVESFLHYQRLREVFFVLETAFTAFADQPELLKTPFTKFTGRKGSPSAKPEKFEHRDVQPDE